ncbi:glycosyltransferase [Lentzea aerocolonigenes]|uniref:glycosyltransferase n=1 Tax=Lentzea aerocolonigenes TaxID=68170 RepID=UPI0004C3DA73|nr:glycosyltransferase [Lentzea aerocolonigenes]MCP2241753.1 Glycosyltransferase involved in cell wall bisynthesis [Lentzea aerocolonigenes]
MKIAMVSAHASPLGQDLDSHVTGLAAALGRHGHDVTIYHRRDDADLPVRVRADHGYDVVHVSAGPPTRLDDDQALPHMGDFASFLLREWAVSQPDVVHGHRWMSGLVSVLGGRRVRVPVVQTFHSLAVSGKQHRGAVERGKIEALVAKEAAHVVATSSSEAFALAAAGVDRRKISVVTSGVDLDAFTPDGPPAHRDQKYRVVVAEPLPSHRSIDAMFTALSRVDGAELVIIGLPGDSPATAELRARAEKIGVAPRVVFVGSVAHEAVPALLRSADAVVCAPAHEPSGAVALEAMACGIPVLATAIGELADVVVDGVTGLLVTPEDSDGLARALHRLLLDDTLRQEFSMASLDRVDARYSWNQVALEVLRVYERAGVPAAKTTDLSVDPVR